MHTLHESLQGRSPAELFGIIQDLEQRLGHRPFPDLGTPARPHRPGAPRVEEEKYEPDIDVMTAVRDVVDKTHRIHEHTGMLGRDLRDLRNQMTEDFRELRRPPGGPPGGPGGDPDGSGGPGGSKKYKSRIPNITSIIIKTGEEKKMADLIERKAQAVTKKVLKGRKRKTLGAIRKKYMDARREATANLRKEKKILTDQMKKDLSRLKRSERAVVKKRKTAEIKAKWSLFVEKFPHWKKIKTVAQLRKLTETVKTHRLRL